MSDLIERLRDAPEPGHVGGLFFEAADEIERLKREVRFAERFAKNITRSDQVGGRIIDEQKATIERLTAALQNILDGDSFTDQYSIAAQALSAKEDTT